MNFSSLLRSKLPVSPIVWLLLVFALLPLACSFTGPVVATDIPRPTDTEEKKMTETQIAALTKIPTKELRPTDTPNENDLAVAVVTDTSGSVVSDIKSALDAAHIPMGDGHVAYTKQEGIVLTEDTYNTFRYIPIPGTGDVADFAIHSNVTWNTDLGLSGCGWFFRIDSGGIDAGKYYEFYFDRLSGAPYYVVNAFKSGGFLRHVGYGYSNSIDFKQDAKNEVLLIARKTEFQIFINGSRINVFNDSTVSKGGFALEASTESGSTTCTYEDTWIWTWDK